MSRIKLFSNLILLFAGVILISSCESNRWFQSEDKLKSKIQTTWSLVRINHSAAPEEWIFKEGKVYRLSLAPVDTIDIGNYSVSTTLTKAFLSITDFYTAPLLNANWEIIELDKGLLYIATDHDGSTGVMQKEFTEK